MGTFSCRTYKQERFEKRVVDGPLQAVPLAKFVCGQGAGSPLLALQVHGEGPASIAAGERGSLEHLGFAGVRVDLGGEKLQRNAPEHRRANRRVARRNVDGERLNIFGREGDASALIGMGLDARLLPVPFEGVHSNPGAAVVAERVGGEADSLGQHVPTSFRKLGDPPIDFEAGLRMVLVLRFRADDVDELQPLLLHRLGHDVGRLLLRIDLTRVGDGGTVPEVAGPVGRVVPVKEFRLPPTGSERLLVKHLGKHGRLGEAGTRVGRRPEIGIVDGQVPGRGTSHRKATNHDAIFVDAVPLFHRFDGLKDVDLSGELVGIAIASVRIQHNCIPRRKRANIFLPVADEIDLAQRFAPAVEPQVETELVVSCRRIGGRNDQAVRLNGVVESRSIAADEQAFRLGPSRGIRLERRGAGSSFAQQIKGRADFSGLEEFSVGQRVVHGLPIDLNVGQERADPRRFGLVEAVDLLSEFVEFLLESNLFFGRHFNSRRRDALRALGRGRCGLGSIGRAEIASRREQQGRQARGHCAEPKAATRSVDGDADSRELAHVQDLIANSSDA